MNLIKPTFSYGSWSYVAPKRERDSENGDLGHSSNASTIPRPPRKSIEPIRVSVGQPPWKLPDVPNSHWLIDRRVCLPFEPQVSMMIDLIDGIPAPGPATYFYQKDMIAWKYDLPGSMDWF